MVSVTWLVSIASIITSVKCAAPVVSDSVPGTEYIATFTSPNFQDGDDITGTVEFAAVANGSVQVNVNIDNLPSTGGPFPYHVHAKAVPSDGNCTGTLAHLNPYNGSANATTAANLEVGDLAGKHGPLKGSSFSTSYVDQYLSLNPNDPAYVGNLSVVIHAADNSRLACANITKETSSSNSTGGNNGGSNSSSNGSSNSSSSASSSINAGMINGVSGAVLGAMVAGLLI